MQIAVYLRTAAVLAISILIAAPSCGEKSATNPQGLPRLVEVRAVPNYGVTERLSSPRAKCGYSGLYRDPTSGKCYSASGAGPVRCLDNGGKYEGQGVDAEGLCHEDWAPLLLSAP